MPPTATDIQQQFTRHPCVLLPIFSRTPRTKYSIQLLSFIASCAGILHPAQNKRANKTIHSVIYGSESDVAMLEVEVRLLFRCSREFRESGDRMPNLRQGFAGPSPKSFEWLRNNW